MENEFRDEENFKSLEKFFDKEINTILTPQEIMILSSALGYAGTLLSMFNQNANIAVFDVKAFTEAHPEYAHIDFNRLDKLDKDTLADIKDTLYKKEEKSEEFSKGDILINSIITIITNIISKLYTSYMKEYGESVPAETVQFYTILENCLQSPINILQDYFSGNL